MKKSKEMEEYRTLGIEELTNKIRDAEEDLFNMKFTLSTGQLENTAKIDNTKRSIARMRTILVEKKGGSK